MLYEKISSEIPGVTRLDQNLGALEEFFFIPGLSGTKATAYIISLFPQAKVVDEQKIKGGREKIVLPQTKEEEKELFISPLETPGGVMIGTWYPT